MPERYLGQYLGRFRIDSVIGSGGFAWVYKGYDPELDISVAVKVLKPQYAGEETFETRFRHEATTAAKLRHPNIIRILAVGRQDSAVYFVMDYLPTSLDDRLRIMGTLPEALLIRLGMDVSAALAFAHREGVIHRDIKTDNILFDEHGNAIVADFGIARAVSGYLEQTGTNMVVGTPQYFSPEQARGLTLDGRADIYSLGVTMFKAATGVLPFQGEDWYEIARQHVEEAPPRPRAFNPALSRAIERVILRCLEKDPAKRYPTGDALHTELVQLLGKAATPDREATVVLQTPVGANATGAVTTSRPRHRGMPGRRAALVAGLAGLSALGVVIATARQHSDAAQPGASVSVPPVQAPPASERPPVESTVSTAPSPTSPAPPTTSASRPSAGALSRELRVSAPTGATISIDGVAVGKGPWLSDRVRAGPHTVSAALPTLAECPTAQVEERIRVQSVGVTEVKLTPRPCGMLMINVINAHPSGARYIVRSPDGVDVASGVVQPDKPIVLPIGTYTLRVSATYCADYTNDVTIAAEQTHREPPIRLLCN